jgi:hypothetical protein
MIVLALQSPYLHRFFQSRKEMKVADLFFTNIRDSVIKNAIRIMYGKLVNVSESDSKRICSFLKMLEVKFKVVSNKEEIEAPLSAQPQEDLTYKENLSQEKVDDISKEATPQAAREPEENALDPNWTLTTTDWERLEYIHHTLERDGSSKHYKCKHCPAISQEYRYAKTHYRNKHQDLEAEKNLLIKVQTERLPLLKKYEEISNVGNNKTLAKHEAETILDRLENFVVELENVQVTLPPHLEYKKRDLLKILGADIFSIRNFITKLPNI